MSDVQHKAIQEINAAIAIKEGIKALTNDDDAIRDTLEGETDLDQQIRALVLSIGDDKALIAGLTAHVAELNERLTRFKNRVEAKRTLILQAMTIADVEKYEFDAATVSRRKTAPAVRVIEEADIPSDYWAPQPPKLDKRKLLAALTEGTIIPGAALSNQHDTVSIRTK